MTSASPTVLTSGKHFERAGISFKTLFQTEPHKLLRRSRASPYWKRPRKIREAPTLMTEADLLLTERLGSAKSSMFKLAFFATANLDCRWQGATPRWGLRFRSGQRIRAVFMNWRVTRLPPAAPA
jgi:hypothetical protein